MPPVELRRSVGTESEAAFANPSGRLAFGLDVPAENYARVLDFGCGCGRVARQMLLQSEDVPHRYLGLDLYEPSVAWTRANLVRDGFEFRHLNIWNAGFNPKGVEHHVDFGTDETFTLVNAHSVFTHIIEDNLRFYFDQCARRLAPNGILRTTWFFFDKINFPMMQTFQNALYINTNDPTNAVIYDVDMVRGLFAEHGLSIYEARRPSVRGHQWAVYAKRSAEPHVAFEADLAPTGVVRAPVSIHS